LDTGSGKNIERFVENALDEVHRQELHVGAEKVRWRHERSFVRESLQERFQAKPYV
jgi:hypothetical protein